MSDRLAQATKTDDVPRVLFVDNFDSFTYNLVEYATESANGDGTVRAEVEVVRNTATVADVRAFDPDAIVISPGPGHPENDRDVGVTVDVLREVSPTVPTFGVCLGLEAAVYAYGGEIGRAPDPVHGKAFPVYHDDSPIYDGLEQGFRAGRYHSLIATTVPECFEVTASTPFGGPENASEIPHDAAPDAGLVMGVRHREHPIECVQFHPESVLTAGGRRIVGNFLTQLQ